MDVVVYVHNSITEELLKQEDCKFKITLIYIANPLFNNSKDPKGDEKKPRWFVKMPVFWLFITMTWYTEVPNQNNPADVPRCWSALLMCIGCGCCHCSCCCSFSARDFSWGKTCGSTKSLKSHGITVELLRDFQHADKEVQVRKNFRTKHCPFFFFFDPIDVNIMRFLSQALYSSVTCARERVHYRLLALM